MIFFVSLYWSEDLSEGFLSSHSFNLGIWSRVSAITEREKRRKNTFQAERSHHCTLLLFPYVLPLVAGLDLAQRVESRDAAYVGFFKKEHLYEAWRKKRSEPPRSGVSPVRQQGFSSSVCHYVQNPTSASSRQCVADTATEKKMVIIF